MAATESDAETADESAGSAEFGRPRRTPQRRRTIGTISLIAATVVCVGALAVLRSAPAAPTSEWSGTLLGVEQPKPDVRLLDTSGQPFSLVADTPRAVTLLMFGYTNCPDVCPISLSTLASALRSLPPTVSSKVQMVFVTADPKRDTAERLREYLDQFDVDFVGLTGTPEQITAAQEEANVPATVVDQPDDDGSYAVGHATQMIAYQADGLARIAYPFGTREGDWVADLPRLVDGERPS